MMVAVNRFASRCESVAPAAPRSNAPSTEALIDGPPSRFMSEIRGRDEYIDSLVARNQLLRLQLEESKREIARLRRWSLRASSHHRERPPTIPPASWPKK
jgi:hypothetical protein